MLPIFHDFCSLGQMKMFAILCSLLLAGQVIASSVDSEYDYGASVECLPEPMPPQYDGGLVANPGFDAGLGDWFVNGKGKIMIRTTQSGNSYMVAYDRTKLADSFAHGVYLQKGLLYTFSAWMQIDFGKEIISAYVMTPKLEHLIIGSVIAQSGCWSMLKGGFTVDEDMKAAIYFVSKNTAIELWLDNVSLKPFTRTEWREHQEDSINNIRKRELIVHVTTRDGIELPGANLTLNQIRPHFMLGCSSTGAILDSEGYQDWFVKRQFPVTSFTNEMKWYYTEDQRDQVNYTVADAMVRFFKRNRVSIRGHTVHWAVPNASPHWAQNLPPKELMSNSIRRAGSVVSRYLGDVIGWDVMNENMHDSFFEDKLGPNASAMFYQVVHAMAPEQGLFLNEYNVLEYPGDLKSIPWKYVEKIREMRAFPGNENFTIRIGLQGHFLLKPNVSHVRASFDLLGATKMPIWLTELDTGRGPHQVEELEDVVREAYSHPAVEGIMIWGNWKPNACNETCISYYTDNSTDNEAGTLPHGCIQMCLVNSTFGNTPAGDMVDRLLGEWRTTDVRASTDKDGVYQQRVFLGEYSLQYSHPLIGNGGTTMFNVTGDGSDQPLEIFITL